MQHEEPLADGNTTVVVRVGNTVRRPTGSWTPATHHLLGHLEAVGFTGSPRVIGIDEHDREILHYVEGEVGTLSPEAPLPMWFRTPEACRAIGAWIRRFQNAQQGYAADPSKPWRRATGSVLAPGQVIVHHDVSPYNTVRRADGSLVVLDWDFARPGGPLEDVAWAAWRWVPLMASDRWMGEYGVKSGADVEDKQRQNLAALLDGYQASLEEREAVVDVIRTQMLQHAEDLQELVRYDRAFADLIARGFARTAREDAAWWAECCQQSAWRSAIRGSEPGSQSR